MSKGVLEILIDAFKSALHGQQKLLDIAQMQRTRIEDLEGRIEVLERNLSSWGRDE
jgi:hypothetical protein